MVRIKPEPLHRPAAHPELSKTSLGLIQMIYTGHTNSGGSSDELPPMCTGPPLYRLPLRLEPRPLNKGAELLGSGRIKENQYTNFA